jgi:hypothetical protein
MENKFKEDQQTLRCERANRYSPRTIPIGNFKREVVVCITVQEICYLTGKGWNQVRLFEFSYDLDEVTIFWSSL